MKNTKIILCSALLAMTMSAGTAFANGAIVEVAASASAAVAQAGPAAMSAVSATLQQDLTAAMEADSENIAVVQDLTRRLENIRGKSGATLDGASAESIEEGLALNLQQIASRDVEERKSARQIAMGELKRLYNSIDGDSIKIKGQAAVDKVNSAFKKLRDALTTKEVGQACKLRGA